MNRRWAVISTDANGITYINHFPEEPLVKTFCLSRSDGLTSCRVLLDDREVAEFIGVDRDDATGQAGEWLYHALHTA